MMALYSTKRVIIIIIIIIINLDELCTVAIRHCLELAIWRL